MTKSRKLSDIFKEVEARINTVSNEIEANLKTKTTEVANSVKGTLDIADTTVEFPRVSSNDVLSTLELSFLSALENELKKQNNDGIAAIETLKVQAQVIAELNKLLIAALNNPKATIKQKRDAQDKLAQAEVARQEFVDNIQQELSGKLKINPKDTNSLQAQSSLVQYKEFLTHKKAIERAIENLKTLEDVKQFNEGQEALRKQITDELGKDIHKSDAGLLELYKTSLPTQVNLIQSEIDKQEKNLPEIDNDDQSIVDKKDFLDTHVEQLQTVVGNRVTGYQQQLRNLAAQFDISKESLDVTLRDAFIAEFEKSKQIKELTEALNDKINSEVRRRELDELVRAKVKNHLKCTKDNSFYDNEKLKQEYENELAALLQRLISHAASNLNATASDIQAQFMYQRHIVVERYDFLQQVWSLNETQEKYLAKQKGYAAAEETTKHMLDTKVFSNLVESNVTLAHKVKVTKEIKTEYGTKPHSDSGKSYSEVVCDALKHRFEHANTKTILEAHRDSLGKRILLAVGTFFAALLFKPTLFGATNSKKNFLAPAQKAMVNMDAEVSRLSNAASQSASRQKDQGHDGEYNMLNDAGNTFNGFKKKK